MNLALSLQPNDADSYRARAEVLARLGDIAGAQADLERAKALEPANTDIATRQAALLEQSGKIAEALEIYGVIIQQNPSADLYVHVGKLRYNRNEYRRALANFLAARELQPDNIEAIRGVGISYRKLGNRAAAITALREYLAKSPQAADRAEIEAWILKGK